MSRKQAKCSWCDGTGLDPKYEGSTCSECAEGSRQWLLRQLKPGDTVFTVLRHVSRPGMSRKIDLYALTVEDGKAQPIFLTGHAAKVLGVRWDRDSGGLIVGGCGMDMGFHVVYELSHALWPNGVTCTGEHCISNDHTNGMPRSSAADAHTQHRDGGYALRQAWL